MKPRLSPLAGALVTAALAAALTGCGKHGKSAPVGGSAVPPSQTKLQRAVEIGPVERRPLEVFVETVGYLEAEGQTDVSAGVPGLVDSVHFREGQWVDRDTVLLKIDQRRYQALLAVADAAHKKAEANVVRAEANVKKADAALDFAVKTKALDDARYEFAFKSKGGVSREELVERDAAVRTSAARVEEARSGVEVAKADLSAARKEVDAAVAQRELAERNLTLSTVRAPYAGQINQRRVTTSGTYVEDKTIIATMADLRHLRLVGWVPEKAAPVVRDMMVADQRYRSAVLLSLVFADPTGLSVLGGASAEGKGRLGPASRAALEFRLLPYPDRVFRAHIFYLSTVASPETHMFECKAEVDDNIDVELKPGYMARIRAPIRGNPNALVVPEEAVRASEHGFVAFVPELQKGRDGKDEWTARRRKVELGYRSGIGHGDEGKSSKNEMKPGMVEVTRGLEPGEWIVTRGAEALEDGSPLAISAEQLAALARRSPGGRD